MIHRCITERIHLGAVMNLLHGAEWILLGIVIMFCLVGIGMIHVTKTISCRGIRELLLVVVMIHRVIGMVLPDREMIRHADKLINLVGILIPPNIVRIHPGGKSIPHITGMTNTMTHTESWSKAEWIACGLHAVNKNVTGQVGQGLQARCVSVGKSI